MRTKICNLSLIAAMLAAVLFSNLRLVQAGNLPAPVNATGGPGYWTDPQGDVTEPSADLISGSITITPDNAYVDVRAQFAGKPLTPVAWNIGWCLNLNQNLAVDKGTCGWGNYSDFAFSLSYNSFYDDYGFAYFDRSEGMMKGVDACQITWYDAATKTLRVKFPRSWLGDDGIFNYFVEASFGGSFGNNERAPNSASLGSPGRYFTSAKTDIELPFAGDRLCSEPALAVDSTRLNFSMVAGEETPPAQRLNLTNTDWAHAPIPWIGVESISWLSLSETSGITSSSTMVSVHPQGLKPGIYSGSIDFTGISADGTSGQTVIITLEILTPTGSAPVFCPASLAGKMGTVNWYQYFGAIKFDSTDQMLVSFSVLPAAAGFTDISLDAEGGGSVYGIHFEDGLVNGTYSYNPGQWNSVEALYNFSARQYTLTINGQTGNPIAFNYGTSASVQAFRLFTETGSAWLDSLSIHRITGSTQLPLFGANFDDGKYSDVAAKPPVVAFPSSCPASQLTLWSVIPLTMNFEVEKGQKLAPAQQIGIEKYGTGNVTWTLTENIPWLGTDRLSGTAPSTVNVSVNPTGLAVGTYTGEITLTPRGVDEGGAETVKVILEVNPILPPPFCPVDWAGKFDSDEWYQYFGRYSFGDTDQMSVSFSIIPNPSGYTDITLDEVAGRSGYGIHFEGGLINDRYAYQPGQWNLVRALYNFSTNQYTLTINGKLAGTLPFSFSDSQSVQSFRIFTENGDAWLDSLMVDRIVGGTRSALFEANFDNGSYSDVAANPPVNVIPSLCPAQPTTWSVDPLTLYFDVERGAVAPPAQQISIGKNGPDAVTWTLAKNSSWLQTNLTSGSAPGTVNISVNPAGLAVERYSDDLILTPMGAIGGQRKVQVNLNVTLPSSATLLVSPKVLNFDAEKGLTDPEPQSIRIMSGNELALLWSLQEEIDWLSIDPVSGTSPAEAQVSIDTSGLEPGSYTGEIHIASSNAKDSPQTVAVSLYVAPQRPPLALTAAGGVNNIRLDWTPSSNPKVMRYRIYRAMEGSPTRQPVAEVQDTVYLDHSTDLLADSRYCYSVEVLGPNDQWLGASTGACAVFGRLELKVGDAWAGSNQEAIIPLLIQNATGLKIAAGDFWLKLDCSLVEPLEVRTTPLTAGYTWNYNISQTGDSCLVKIAALSNPPVELFGQGALFWLKVKVRAVEAVDSPMELQPFTAGSGGTEIYRPDNLTTPLALQMQNGTLHLSQNYRLGDLNGNGVVQAVDAYIALQIASGIYTPLDWQRYCGDANSDGRISPADASMILYYAVTSNWPQPTQAAIQPVLAKAADEPVKLSLSSGRAAPGGTVQIILRAENLMNFAGTHLVVAYDPRFIASVSQVEAIGLGKNFSLDFNDDGLGMVKIAMADRSGISGSGDLLRLTLRVKANAPRETRTMLALAEVHLNDPFGRDFATSALQQSVLRTNGSVTLRDETIYLPVMGW